MRSRCCAPRRSAEESLRHLSEFLSLSDTTALGRGIEELIEQLVHAASHVMRAERASLFLVDPASGELWSMVAEGEESRPLRLPTGKGIAGSVAGEVASVAPFALELGAVELFPSPRRARVVALEVAPEGRLTELAGAVQRGVVEQGFEPEERPFRAHLTLGRVRNRRIPSLEGVPAPAAPALAVRDVVLFQSELARDGARYTALERLPLATDPITP